MSFFPEEVHERLKVDIKNLLKLIESEVDKQPQKNLCDHVCNLMHIRQYFLEVLIFLSGKHGKEDIEIALEGMRWENEEGRKIIEE